MKHKVILRFLDKNQPSVIVECEEDYVDLQIAQLVNTYAGIKGIFVDTPEGDRKLYLPNGEYVGTIQAKDIIKFGKYIAYRIPETQRGGEK